MKNKPLLLLTLLPLAFGLACALTGSPTPPRPLAPEPATVNIPASPLPPPTPVAPPTPIPEPSAGPAVSSIQVYLVALEDAGASGEAVGCGDSLVPATFEIEPTSGVLRAALEKLLSLRERTLGESGLYNALYQSDLRVERIELDNGNAVIELSGSLKSGGVCDDPRILGQLRATALQFNTVRQARFFVNGRPLEELLSSK